MELAKLLGRSSRKNAAPPSGQQAGNASQNGTPAKKKRKNPFRKPRDKAKDGQAVLAGRDAMQGNNVVSAAQNPPQKQAVTMPTPKQTATAEDAMEEGVVSELSEHFTVFSDPVDAVGGTVGDVGDYIGTRADYEDSRPGHLVEKDDDQKDKQGEHTSSVMGATSSGLGAMTSGLTAIAGGLGAWDNFSRLHAMRQARQQGNLSVSRLDMADVGLQGSGNTAQAVTSSATTATSLGGMGAGIASAADAGNAAASTAADAFGGLGDSIGAVGGAVQLVVSGARLGVGVAKNLRNPDEADWAATATDSIGTLKGFLSTANSTVSAVSAFLQIAGAAAELANALPLVGAAVNICIQLLDILIQVINFTKALVKLVQARITANKMDAKGKEAGATADEKEMYKNLSDVNNKRYKRQILPMVTSVVNGMADLISIGGSVVNICGVATAPAYGAGVAVMAVGYGMSATAGLVKLGTALSGPIARLHRAHKHFGRDVKAGERDGKMADMYRTLGFTGAFGDRSTSVKNAEYEKTIGTIYAMLAALPATYSDQDAEKFENAHQVIKATGVSTKKLYATTTEPQASELLLAALKERD